MATVSFQAPTDYSVEAADIDRRRKYAELLQQQAMQPVQEHPTPAGGFAVPISWTQGLAKALQGYAANKGIDKASADAKALAAQRQAALAQAIQGYDASKNGTPTQTVQQPLDTSQEGTGSFDMSGSSGPPTQPVQHGAVPGNPRAAAMSAMLSPYPEMQAVGKLDYAQLAKQDAPYNLKEGETRFGAGGIPVAALPKTLSPDTVFKEAGLDRRFSGVSGNTAATQAGADRRFSGVSGNTAAQIASAQAMHASPSGSAILAQGQTPSLSEDAKDAAAARYNIDGTLPPMGMGKDGARAREDILNRAAMQAKSSGATPEEQRVTQIGNKANTASLTKLQSQESMVGAFEKTFNKNADIATEYSKKVDRTGVPVVNSWINAGKRAITGNPELSAYDAAVKATVNEYTKIISGSMGNTPMAEGEIKKVEGLLNAAQTPQQVNEVISFMKRETQNRMKGFAEQKAELRQSMTPQRRSTDGGKVVDFNSLPK